MHLVVHQVVELEHVHVTHGDLSVEGVAGAPVVERDLAAFVHARQLQQLLDALLGGAIENRRCHRHTGSQVARQFEDLVITEIIQVRRSSRLAL
jgi:hypothetical protein